MTRTMLTTQLFDAAVDAYERGDYATALAGLQNYAEQGNATAQFNLGLMYANGEGVPKDDAEAVRWYRLAVGVFGIKCCVRWPLRLHCRIPVARSHKGMGIM